jgi:hypothetical protein
MPRPVPAHQDHQKNQLRRKRQSPKNLDCRKSKIEVHFCLVRAARCLLRWPLLSLTAVDALDAAPCSFAGLLRQGKRLYAQFHSDLPRRLKKAGLRHTEKMEK